MTRRFVDVRNLRVATVRGVKQRGADERHIEGTMPPKDGQLSTSERWSMIEHYEAIAGASRRMLEAARGGQWDQVAVEEDNCRVLIDGLKRAHAAGRTPARRGERLALLRSMLADDAEIRELSEPWLRQLEALLARRPEAEQ